jgi:uncharacterized damage-inducible protein DinB
MSIGMERLLRHMAWANQNTIEHLKSLPEEALKSFATNSEWFVADAYVFRITGEHPNLPGESITEIEKIADLDSLAQQAAVIDAALLDSVKLDDEQLEFTNYSGNLVRRWRSTILSQAIHHATEHRAQIAAAIEARGFSPLNLDDLDLWSYETEQG